MCAKLRQLFFFNKAKHDHANANCKDTKHVTDTQNQTNDFLSFDSDLGPIVHLGVRRLIGSA